MFWYVAGLQSPIIGTEPHTAAVHVGESVSFRCKVYSGAAPVRMEWRAANNQPLLGTIPAITYTGRCTMGSHANEEVNIRLGPEFSH